ncbi:hypothetical protein PHSY_004131 [Pseudozyma hubeiensis SY62]|uniref:Uncharacterized protein n=1 Tax=Pseudozyma hubeiensis (strain SY62) TaxID=1305764 RepID=R9P5B0_PSEHS|nr:hypothetical protein PHSY_004131 [Pseudozyma hubeiensis SY62]GAC96551.1 hypothetical protein PHSY_004131 [Pseudozyma hubeiensis SY62]
MESRTAIIVAVCYESSDRIKFVAEFICDGFEPERSESLLTTLLFTLRLARLGHASAGICVVSASLVTRLLALRLRFENGGLLPSSAENSSSLVSDEAAKEEEEEVEEEEEEEDDDDADEPDDEEEDDDDDDDEDEDAEEDLRLVLMGPICRDWSCVPSESLSLDDEDESEDEEEES